MINSNSTFVKKFEAIMPQGGAGIVDKDVKDTTMPVLEINGTDLVGLLKYETNGKTFAVYSEWSSRLTAARPAYYKGSAESGTLIIAANDSKGLFDFAGNLTSGEEFTFTDVYGRTFAYSVAKIEHRSADISNITSHDYDLTIFVRVSLNKSLVIRCSVIQ